MNFTFAGLVVWSLLMIIVLLTGVFLIVRMWVKARFTSIEKRTAVLEHSIAEQRPLDDNDDSIVRAGGSRRG